MAVDKVCESPAAENAYGDIDFESVTPEDALRETMEFLVFSYTGCNDFKGVVRFNLVEKGNVLSTVCVMINDKKAEVMDHVPEESDLTLIFSSDAAKQMYKGELSPIKAVLGGTVQFNMWRLSSLKQFCYNFDFATQKWVEFYKHQAQRKKDFGEDTLSEAPGSVRRSLSGASLSHSVSTVSLASTQSCVDLCDMGGHDDVESMDSPREEKSPEVFALFTRSPKTKPQGVLGLFQSVLTGENVVSTTMDMADRTSTSLFEKEGEKYSWSGVNNQFKRREFERKVLSLRRESQNVGCETVGKLRGLMQRFRETHGLTSPQQTSNMGSGSASASVNTECRVSAPPSPAPEKFGMDALDVGTLKEVMKQDLFSPMLGIRSKSTLPKMNVSRLWSSIKSDMKESMQSAVTTSDRQWAPLVLMTN